jgi:hypothetical protein
METGNGRFEIDIKSGRPLYAMDAIHLDHLVAHMDRHLPQYTILDPPRRRRPQAAFHETGASFAWSIDPTQRSSFRGPSDDTSTEPSEMSDLTRTGRN